MINLNTNTALKCVPHILGYLQTVAELCADAHYYLFCSLFQFPLGKQSFQYVSGETRTYTQTLISRTVEPFWVSSRPAKLVFLRFEANQFWHFPVLKDSDIFRFWRFPVLTRIKQREKIPCWERRFYKKKLLKPEMGQQIYSYSKHSQLSPCHGWDDLKHKKYYKSA